MDKVPVEIYRIRYYIDFISPFSAKVKEEITIKNPTDQPVPNFLLDIHHIKNELHVYDEDNKMLEFYGRSPKSDVIEVFFSSDDPLPGFGTRTITCEHYMIRTKAAALKTERERFSKIIYSDVIFRIELDQSARVYGVINKKCDYTWHVGCELYKKARNGEMDYSMTIMDPEVHNNINTHDAWEFQSRHLGLPGPDRAHQMLVVVTFEIPSHLRYRYLMVQLMCLGTIVLMAASFLAYLWKGNDTVISLAFVLGTLIAAGTFTVLEGSRLGEFDNDMIPSLTWIQNLLFFIIIALCILFIAFIVHSVI
ncbi:MAG TPA: hypothetical protein VGJ92_12650 [Methanocella sp.]